MSAAEALAALLAGHFLTISGRFAPLPSDGLPDWVGQIILLSPAEPGFWPHLTAQPEWLDGQPDPVDRWSRRGFCRLARDLGGKALFPFGGPPYQPFYQWALRSGRAWDSPVRLLVQADQGLMISYRGALGLPGAATLPPAERPCTDCAQPCLTACPAGALTAAGYDVPACHAYLDRHPDGPCLTGGCLVRRACPVSQGYARLPEQSAYHMSRFHKAE